jgi:RNA polymerase sigma-70 factor (ECF subfamily)
MMLDIAILQQYLLDSSRGNHKAFQSLYENTSPYLYSLALRLLKDESLASEVLQEAFVQIWYGAKDYQADKGSPMAWMATIVRYRALDLIRREKSQKTRMEAAGKEPVYDDAPEPSETVENSKEMQKLIRCLQPIQAEQRKSILLAFYNGYSHAEIAKIVNAPIGTVKSWIRRGLSRVRECMHL